MRIIVHFLKLIRWKNLAIISATQLLIWLCVMHSFAQQFHIPLFLTWQKLSLLIASTVLIAASGYIINDYFDVKIDIRNRPHKVIIGRIIKKRWAMAWHTLFNIGGIGIGFFLANEIGHIGLVFIQIGSTLLLWVYSTHLKRMFVSGNVAVALLTSLSIITLLFYEPTIYPYIEQKSVLIIQEQIVINPFWIIAVYTFFAFLLTWMREVVKDMEDFKGDKEEGCVTMPIKIGLQKTNYFVLGLSVIALIPLMISSYILCNTVWFTMGIYIIVALLIPISFVMYLLPRKFTMKHYGKISFYLKMIMILGILSLPLYAYLIFN